MPALLPSRLRDPVVWTGLSQLLKTVLAAVLAWVIALHVFGISQPFLAPWAALLTVHATVYRTLRRGVQQVMATVLGVLIAFAVGSTLGLDALSLGLAILVGLLLGSVRGLRAETTTAAATALVVLTTGHSDESLMLVGRLLDTGIGIAMGLVVNLIVWPPLRDRSAARLIDVIDDRIGDLLTTMATELRRGGPAVEVAAWLARSAELDDDIEKAWGVVRQARESARLNPRRAAPRRLAATADYDDLLERLEHAVAEIRSMARTIGLASIAPDAWDERFRHPWLELLESAGAAVSAADVLAVTAVRAELEAFTADLPVAELPAGFWPVAGALIANLRNLLVALDAVADVQPVEVPPPAWRAVPAPAR